MDWRKYYIQTYATATLTELGTWLRSLRDGDLGVTHTTVNSRGPSHVNVSITWLTSAPIMIPREFRSQISNETLVTNDKIHTHTVVEVGSSGPIRRVIPTGIRYDRTLTFTFHTAELV